MAVNKNTDNKIWIAERAIDAAMSGPKYGYK